MLPVPSKYMEPESNPADLIPIQATINGRWRIKIWTNTSEFMQKRQGGQFFDDLLMRALQIFHCDGRQFAQIQKLHGKNHQTVSGFLDQEWWDGRVKVWSTVRNNVLETNQYRHMGGKDKVYMHENRFIRDDRLHIVNHCNVRVDGEMTVKSECLRIFVRVPETVWRPRFIPIFPPMVCKGPVIHRKVVPVVKIEKPKELVTLKITPLLPMVTELAQKVPTASKKDSKVPVVAKNTKLEPALPKVVSEPILPVLAEQETPKAEQKTRCIDKEQETPQDLQTSISGQWKLLKVDGWPAFMKAGRFDQELMYATANILIANTGKTLHSHYSTTVNALERTTYDRLDEPMELMNGTTKYTFFEDNFLRSATWDSKTKKEVSRMVRCIEDGKLKSQYQCGDFKFEVVHEKV